MKFFFAESLDTVDPTYDFISESSAPGRNRQTDDEFAHQVLGSPPFDGLLVSRALLDPRGSAARYSQSQRLRFEREGVRDFFGLGPWPDITVMGDCGAYSLPDSKHTMAEAADLVDFYDRCGFDYGVSRDYLIPEFKEAWDSRKRRPTSISARFDATIANAQLFLHECQRRRVRFTPIGAFQFWSPRSAVLAAQRLVDMGYGYLGVGGLAARRCLSR